MEFSRAYVLVLLSFLAATVAILLKLFDSKPTTRKKIHDLLSSKKGIIILSFTTVILLSPLIFNFIFAFDNRPTFEINDGIPINIKSTDSLSVVRIKGKKVIEIFVSIDGQINRYFKKTSCSCWTVPLKDYPNLLEGNHNVLIGSDKEWVLQNHTKLYERIVIDNSPPEVKFQIDKRNFKDGKLDVKISGQSNEEVDIKVIVPREGENYIFSSTKDSVNGKFIYSFTYDIFNINVPDQSIDGLKDFSVEFIDSAKNRVMHKENPGTFFKTGTFELLLEKANLSVEKRIIDGGDYTTMDDGSSSVSTWNQKETLRIAVKLISSKEIHVNWELDSTNDNVRYSVYRNNQILASNVTENFYVDRDVVKDSVYQYAVEALVDGQTFARSRKENQTAWITVAKDGTGDFENIEDAKESVKSGSTVFIRKGKYRSGARFSSNSRRTAKNLRLIGENRNETIIESPDGVAFYVDENVSSVLIENVTFRNFYTAIEYNIRNRMSLEFLKVKNCSFLNCRIGIKTQIINRQTLFLVEDSNFENCSKSIRIENYSNNPSIRTSFVLNNNLFQDSFLEILHTDGEGSPFSNNTNTGINFRISCSNNSFFGTGDSIKKGKEYGEWGDNYIYLYDCKNVDQMNNRKR